jgi:uncharacterized membrane protein YfcA
VIFIAIGGLGIFLLGVSKTGFGGSGGNLAVPLVALLLSARETLAILLPVLIVADLFSLWFYRFKWNRELIKVLALSSIVGIVVGGLLLDVISDFYLKKTIGLIAVGFVAIQFLRRRIVKQREAYIPKRWHGLVFGGATGAMSTMTHAAGPLLSIFLLPMRLKKEVFVATTVLYFAIVNYLKLVPYTILGIMSRVISDERFTFIIYMLLLFTGIQLVTGLNVMEMLLTSL